jgi:hypothetical protein
MYFDLFKRRLTRKLSSSVSGAQVKKRYTTKEAGAKAEQRKRCPGKEKE